MEHRADIDRAVDRLTAYGLEKGLIGREDVIWARNSLLALLDKSDYGEAPLPEGETDLAAVLSQLTEYAVGEGLVHDDNVSRDLFDTRLMGALTPRPSQVIQRFWEEYRESPAAATDWYYAFSGDTNYIRRDRIARDLKWTVDTDYGALDITINLSKPEKDPRAIAGLLKKEEDAEFLFVEPNIKTHKEFPLTDAATAISRADVLVCLVAHKEFAGLPGRKPDAAVLNFCNLPGLE